MEFVEGTGVCWVSEGPARRWFQSSSEKTNPSLAGGAGDDWLSLAGS